MQAVILAAGASTRFYPLSESMPKPMVTLLGKPILANTILSLAKMDISNIVMVTSNETTIKSYFGDGKKFGVNISYVTQNKPLGMADALLQAKSLIKDDFFLLNGHHLDIGEYILSMVTQKRRCNGVLLVQERENPWEYGVVKHKDQKITGLIEKPNKGSQTSNLCVVGIYLLGQDFISFLEKIPSSHYQLEEALDKYSQANNLLFVNAQTTVTLKYPWDLLNLKNYLLEKTPHRISRGAKIGKGVILVGKMVIEDGAVIHENAVIKGPVYIGKNSLIGNNALVRDMSCLEEGVHVGAFSEVKNSLLLPNAHLGSGFMASSIIGENCRLAHGFTTANRRFDRKSITVMVKDKKVDTGLTDLGTIMGNDVYAGINVSIMPGKTIGKEAIIGPGTFVFDDVPPGTNFYNQFKQIVKK
ncbi:MAG: bifunctional sugar-1-phosphate nucleotidylyltransferase/acetyltransferase [Candidatus Gottesmanbacteria bacterium]